MKIKSIFLAAILATVLCVSGNVFAVLSGGGTEANPYLIQSRADFDEFANPANAATYWASGKYTKLMCDLDLSGTTYIQAVIAADIDNVNSDFEGIFNGNGHKVSNLTITASAQEYIGLFGNVGLGGQIRYLGVEGVNVTGNSLVGGMVGYNQGTLTACYSTGLINGTGEISYVGGLVGINVGTLLSCYATSSVSGIYEIGGLVGNDSGTLTNCYASGSVSGTGEWPFVGGLVGGMSSSTLTCCYATGSVNGIGDWPYAGGLVGEVYSGALISCYATGSVSGTNDYVGGLVGYNDSGSISDCYATGLVVGAVGYVGGFLGGNDSGLLTACFWDINTSGMTDGVGNMDPDPNGVTGKTTLEMQTQSTFNDAGWDFSNTDGDGADWVMLQSGADYPKLAWQYPSGTILWQAGKTRYYSGYAYLISIRITISDMKACFIKGPNMTVFEPASWVPGRGQWYFPKFPLDINQLQKESFGTWQLKLVDENDQESIYSFTISGTLEDSEFLPVPVIIEPEPYAAGVIAEHYLLRWNPNGAQTEADVLNVQIVGNGFDYYSNSLDLSATEWNPGWLEIGEAYCRVGYFKNRPDMIDTPVLVSGSEINWQSTNASLASGPTRPFTVKYSLDFNNDDRIDLADLTVFCSHWLEPAPSAADFDDGGMVEFEDFAIFAQHWLEDVNNIADHVFSVSLTTEWDYCSPNDSSDDEYGFEIAFTTDDTVNRIEFTTPAGNTFEIPNIPQMDYPIVGGWMEIGREFDVETGQYEWFYCPNFSAPNSLFDYGDGLYTFSIYFVGGRVQQTTAWFGIPGTADPIPQPTQEPVFTSFGDGDTVSSPVMVTWKDCNDPAVEYLQLGGEYESGEEMESIFLPVDANRLDEPLDLMPGVWDHFELSFEKSYECRNTDGISVVLSKYSCCDYEITVVNNIADLNGDGKVDDVDLGVLANQWLQPPGSPSADIAPQPDGNGIVNFEDFTLFARNWLEGI